jgi:hypothetical protein
MAVTNGTHLVLLERAVRRIFLPEEYLRMKYRPDVNRSSRLMLEAPPGEVEIAHGRQ